MKNKKLSHYLLGLPNMTLLIEEDNNIQEKLINNGFTSQEIKEYFQVKKNYITYKINKRNNGLLSLSLATTAALVGLNTPSDSRLIAFSGMGLLILNGGYNLIKKNKYSAKIKKFEKKYEINSSIK